jgi:hypothetical protein
MTFPVDMHRAARALGFALAGLFLPLSGWSAELDGRSLAVWWALPFAGVLLSIALFPLVAMRVWHHHYG